MQKTVGDNPIKETGLTKDSICLKCKYYFSWNKTTLLLPFVSKEENEMKPKYL